MIQELSKTNPSRFLSRPARQRDKLVRVWITMPIDFNLEDAP
jgi:hypothetical protein